MSSKFNTAIDLIIVDAKNTKEDFEVYTFLISGILFYIKLFKGGGKLEEIALYVKDNMIVDLVGFYILVFSVGVLFSVIINACFKICGKKSNNKELEKTITRSTMVISSIIILILFVLRK